MDTINKSFKKAIVLGAFTSFDEATFSSRSCYIPARQFNPFKPHKFGLKLFMLCCGVIGYCYSFEIYQGKSTYEVEEQKSSEQEQQVGETPVARLDDTMTGPAAMLRNCLWMNGSHRTVFCDRFYTSIGVCCIEFSLLFICFMYCVCV